MTDDEHRYVTLGELRAEVRNQAAKNDTLETAVLISLVFNVLAFVLIFWLSLGS